MRDPAASIGIAPTTQREAIVTEYETDEATTVAQSGCPEMRVSVQRQVSEGRRGRDPQLGDLLDRRARVAMSIERRAAEVVRDWLVAHERDWLGVDFTKTRVESPLVGDEDVAAAVQELPGCVFRYATDVRDTVVVRAPIHRGRAGRLAAAG